MNMLTLNGRVLNVFQSPEGVNKEGQKYGGQHRVQIMCQNTLQNGEIRVDLVNLTVDNPTQYQKLVNRLVRVPVGVFVSAGAAAFYALKGVLPEAIGEPAPQAT